MYPLWGNNVRQFIRGNSHFWSDLNPIFAKEIKHYVHAWVISILKVCLDWNWFAPRSFLHLLNDFLSLHAPDNGVDGVDQERQQTENPINRTEK